MVFDFFKGSKLETGIRVGDIMTRNFIFVSPDTDLKTCARTLTKRRVGSLIVKDKSRLLGILTEKDIIWAIVKKSVRDLKDIQAKDIMKRKVITIKPSADVLEAVRRFKKKKVRRLPVVEHGKVIGLITLNDILKVDPGLFQMIIQSIKIREQTSKLRKSVSVSKGCGICEVCGEYDLLQEDESQSICESCFDSR